MYSNVLFPNNFKMTILQFNVCFCNFNDLYVALSELLQHLHSLSPYKVYSLPFYEFFITLWQPSLMKKPYTCGIYILSDQISATETNTFSDMFSLFFTVSPPDVICQIKVIYLVSGNYLTYPLYFSLTLAANVLPIVKLSPLDKNT